MPSFKPGDLALIAYPNPISGLMVNCGKVVKLIEPWGDKPRSMHGVSFGWPTSREGVLWLVEAQGVGLEFVYIFQAGTPTVIIPEGPIAEERLIPLGDESMVKETEYGIEHA